MGIMGSHEFPWEFMEIQDFEETKGEALFWHKEMGGLEDFAEFPPKSRIPMKWTI